MVEKAKRRRVSAPKRRTGCGTCKIRHKRCDEAKPVCETCRATGRVCDGYIDPSTGQQFGGHAAGRVSCIPQLAPRALFANEEEAQGFQFFVNATDIQLAAALQNHGWTPPFLQLSHQDPSICHAVIANGIMSRRYQANALSAADDSQSISLYQAALQQYGKAVACFRSQLAASPLSLENAPACCVLLILFEFMQGNAASLLLHLKNATRIADSVNTGPQAGCFVNLLALIDMVAAMWLDLERSYSDVSLRLSISQMPLTRHSDLVALGYDLSDIKNEVMTWRHVVVSARRETVDLNSFSTAIQSRLDFWHQEFVAVSPNEDDIAWRRNSLLQANYLATMLVVDSVHNRQQQLLSEKPIRAAPAMPKLRYFYEIIELTDAVLEADYSFSRYDVGAGEESLEATGLLPLFSFRHSFIQPLFYVAQNAPYMRLRQRAIQLLLEKPWREGAWDSFIMGSIAKRSLC